MSGRSDAKWPRTKHGLLGIPVELLSLIAYILIFISLRIPGERALAGYALGLIAVVFTFYLTYREAVAA